MAGACSVPRWLTSTARGALRLNVQYNPHYNVDMKTIQITIDEKLLTRMDRVLKGRPRLRSAFIRESIANQLTFLRNAGRLRH